jgi:hypothetical protein
MAISAVTAIMASTRKRINWVTASHIVFHGMKRNLSQIALLAIYAHQNTGSFQTFSSMHHVENRKAACMRSFM